MPNNFFSMKTCGFYPAHMIADYQASGSWPDDAIEVTSENEFVLRDAIAKRSSIARGKKGTWVITPALPPAFSSLASPFLDAVRKRRDGILNRLAGIGFAAMADGNADTVQAIAAARTWLLDITTCQTVAAAQDIEMLQAAVNAEYARIAATLSGEARSAFDDTAGMASTQ